MSAIVLDVLLLQPQSPTAAMEKSGISFIASIWEEISILEYRIIVVKVKITIFLNSDVCMDIEYIATCYCIC
jgi:hypothetical protein